MARIRSIKPEFWTSEQVVECSTNARLLFIGMWNFADDQGRMTFSPKKIKAQVFPADDISVDDIRRMLDELSASALIHLYSIENAQYIQITGWHHQRIDRPVKSKIPEPPSKPRRQLVEPSATDRIGVEGKGVEGKEESKQASSARELKLRTGITKAFEAANSPSVPDTGRAALWLAQGYRAEICLAVVSEGVSRKPSISTLAYFDRAIAEAHASAPKNGHATEDEPEMCSLTGLPSIPMRNVKAAIERYKETGKWNDDIIGPPPGSAPLRGSRGSVAPPAGRSPSQGSGREMSVSGGVEHYNQTEEANARNPGGAHDGRAT